MSVFGEKKRVGTLEEDLCQLVRRMDTLESRAKISKLEAAEVYEKTMSLMQRMAKRYAVDLKENGGDPDPEPDNETSDGVDSISAAIHARRNRGFLSR